MKNYKLFLTAFLFTIFTLISAGSTAAQTEIPMTVNVPFEFYVGDKSFSAGNYTLKRIRNEAFLIQGENENGNLIVPTPSTARIARSVKSEQIIFNRYGNRYFLRQIFSNRNADGFALLQSKTEKSTKKELPAGKKSLKNGFASEQVAIELKAN